MKVQEAAALLEDIEKHFEKNGLPVNIRNESNEEITRHICKIVERHIHIDEPLGVTQGQDYDHCPKCWGIIGQSAYYCKSCGAYIRRKQN